MKTDDYEDTLHFLLWENIGARITIIGSDGPTHVGELAEVHNDYITVVKRGGTDVRHYRIAQIAGVSFG